MLPGRQIALKTLGTCDGTAAGYAGAEGALFKKLLLLRLPAEHIAHSLASFVGGLFLTYFCLPPIRFLDIKLFAFLLLESLHASGLRGIIICPVGRAKIPQYPPNHRQKLTVLPQRGGIWLALLTR